MAIAIKLMPDYGSWPLWWAGEHEPGNLHPLSLPLQQKTRDRLEGLALWKQLREELAPEYNVLYQDPETGKLLSEP